MAIREIIDVVKELSETSKLPAPADPETRDPRHATYHRLIVIGGCFFAAVAVLLTFALFYLGLQEHSFENYKEVHGAIVLPFFTGIAGFIFGMCVMCMFAPTEFLTGPIGERWMRKIGTMSVVGARTVCLVFALLIAVPVTWAAISIAQDESARAAKRAAAPPANQKAADQPKPAPSREQLAAEAARKKALAAANADLVFTDALTKALEQFGHCRALQESDRGFAESLIIRSDIAPYLRTSLMGKSIAENLPQVVQRLTQTDWKDIVDHLMLYGDQSPTTSELTALLGSEDSNAAPVDLPLDQLPPKLHAAELPWHQYGRIWFGAREEKVTIIVVDIQKH